MKRFILKTITCILLTTMVGLNLVFAEEPGEKFNNKVSIEDLIKYDWDKKITHISDMFPKGTITRGDLKKKQLSCYQSEIYLTDINVDATLYIEQNEDYIREISEENFTIRTIVIKDVSSKRKEELINAIRDALKKRYNNISLAVGIDHAMYSYILSDEKDENKINFIFKNDLKNCIHIEISLIEEEKE